MDRVDRVGFGREKGRELKGESFDVFVEVGRLARQGKRNQAWIIKARGLAKITSMHQSEFV